ncbi:MAG: molecular chaperone GrpE [Parcubacteria group bacterium Gr01-1014_29]|nr:MAG: molecular chaperone GrpE [Parcubacteria group bacterium Gr01-1014_29]
MAEEETYIDDTSGHGIEEPENNSLIEKISALKKDLAQCRKEKEEYLSGWQRCQADSINFRQEEERKRKDYIQFATQEIIQKLIPVLDAFEHAFSGKDKSDPYIRGFGHIYAQLRTILEEYGLELIEATGKPFDASCHEALENIPVENKNDDGIVIEEVEKGYILHGKVIKPSKVKVGEYKTTNNE